MLSPRSTEYPTPGTLIPRSLANSVRGIPNLRTAQKQERQKDFIQPFAFINTLIAYQLKILRAPFTNSYEIRHQIILSCHC
jgi:hypothetical protein